MTQITNHSTEMPKQPIYIVVEGRSAMKSILGVFSNRIDAEAFADKDASRHVVEHDMDAMCEYIDKEQWYIIHCDDGTFWPGISPAPCRLPVYPEERERNFVKFFRDKFGKNYYFGVRAINTTQAMQIAKDRYNQIYSSIAKISFYEKEHPGVSFDFYTDEVIHE